MKTVAVAGALLTAHAFVASKSSTATSFVQTSQSAAEITVSTKLAWEEYYNHHDRAQCKPTIQGTPLLYALNAGNNDIPMENRPHCLEIVSYGFTERRVLTYPSGYSYGFQEGLVSRDTRVVLYPGCKATIKYCAQAPSTHMDVAVDEDPEWVPTLIAPNKSPNCPYGQATPVTLSEPGAYYLPGEITPKTAVLDPLNPRGSSAPYENSFATPSWALTGTTKAEIYLTSVEVVGITQGPVATPCVTLIDGAKRIRGMALSPSSSLPYDFSVDSPPPPSSAAGMPEPTVPYDALRIERVQVHPGCMLRVSQTPQHLIYDDFVLGDPSQPHTTAWAASKFSLTPKSETSGASTLTANWEHVASHVGHPGATGMRHEGWEAFMSPGKYSMRRWMRMLEGAKARAGKGPHVSAGGDDLFDNPGAEELRMLSTEDAGDAVAIKGLSIMPTVRLRVVGKTDDTDVRRLPFCVTFGPEGHDQEVSLQRCNGRNQSFLFNQALGQLMPLKANQDPRSRCLSLKSRPRNGQGLLADDDELESDRQIDNALLFNSANNHKCGLAAKCDRKGKQGFQCRPVLEPCEAHLASKRDNEEFIEGSVADQEWLDAVFGASSGVTTTAVEAAVAVGTDTMPEAWATNALDANQNLTKPIHADDLKLHSEFDLSGVTQGGVEGDLSANKGEKLASATTGLTALDRFLTPPPTIIGAGLHQAWQVKEVDCEIPLGLNLRHTYTKLDTTTGQIIEAPREPIDQRGFVVMMTLVDDLGAPLEYCLTAVTEEEEVQGGFEHFVDPEDLPIGGSAIRVRRCGVYASNVDSNGCPYARQMFVLDYSIMTDDQYVPPGVPKLRV